MAHFSKDVADLLKNYSSDRMSASPEKKRPTRSPGGSMIKFSDSGSDGEVEVLSRPGQAVSASPIEGASVTASSAKSTGVSICREPSLSPQQNEESLGSFNPRRVSGSTHSSQQRSSVAQENRSQTNGSVESNSFSRPAHSSTTFSSLHTGQQRRSAEFSSSNRSLRAVREHSSVRHSYSQPSSIPQPPPQPHGRHSEDFAFSRDAESFQSQQYSVSQSNSRQQQQANVDIRQEAAQKQREEDMRRADAQRHAAAAQRQEDMRRADAQRHVEEKEMQGGGVRHSIPGRSISPHGRVGRMVHLDAPSERRALSSSPIRGAGYDDVSPVGSPGRGEVSPRGEKAPLAWLLATLPVALQIDMYCRV